MTKENILITGGAGYIGSILSEKLLKNNFNVTVYDNFLYKQNSVAHLCSFEKFNIVKGDVRDTKNLNQYLRKADYIIPLAALVGAPICNFDPIGSKSINHDAIIEMLDYISDDQIILMPTTNSAYGSGDKNNFCDESSKLNPISNYAKDKVSIEMKLLEHPNFISFRLATVFGMSPRMRLDLLVNDFVYRAFNDKFIVLFEGHFVRNYIHVKDVSRVFNFAIKNYDAMKNKIFNVGLSNANLNKIELCKKIQSMLSNFVYLENGINKDPDQRNYIVSNQRIESYGFKPKFSLEDGILELIKGYEYLKNNHHTNF